MNISVVIPLFNNATTIERAVDSVLAQLIEGDELIIIDDGSTDGSSDIAKSFERTSNLVHVYIQANKGVSAARNLGIFLALHNGVILLDADDWWLKGVRSKFSQLISRWPEAQAWSLGHYRVDKDKQVLIDSGLRADMLLIRGDFIMHYGKFSGTINSSSVCVKKSSILRIGGFPEGATSGEDVYMWLRLAIEGGIAVSPDALVCIERSLSGKDGRKKRDVIGYHYRYFCDKGLLKSLDANVQSNLKGFLARNGIRQIGASVLHGDRVGGLKIARIISQAIWWFPFVAYPLLLAPSGVLRWTFHRRHGLDSKLAT